MAVESLGATAEPSNLLQLAVHGPGLLPQPTWIQV